MAFMTTAQAAEFLAVKPTTIRTMIKRGDIQAVKIGSEYRIDETDITAFINRNKTSSSLVFERF